MEQTKEQQVDIVGFLIKLFHSLVNAIFKPTVFFRNNRKIRKNLTLISNNLRMFDKNIWKNADLLTGRATREDKSYWIRLKALLFKVKEDSSSIRSALFGGKWTVTDVRVVSPARAKVTRGRDRYTRKWFWEPASNNTKIIKVDISDRSGPWIEGLEEAIGYGADAVVRQLKLEKQAREQDLAEAAKAIGKA